MVSRELEVSRDGRPVGTYPIGEMMSLGRSPANDLVLDDASISRVHALLVTRDGRCHLQDTGSKNGLFIDRVRVTRTVLEHDLIFSLGAYQCRLVERELAPGGSGPADATASVRSITAERSSPFIGNSTTTRSMLELVRKVSKTSVNVLVTGESGSGKGVITRLLHAWSGRSQRPLIVANCAAIPSELIESELFGHRKGSFTGAVVDRIGKFQAADSGTLILDEVGDMSGAAQAKILRAIEEQEIEVVGSPGATRIDVRVIGATNKDLEQEVAEGRFREDLLFRLATVRIDVPPLRERPDDVLLLANAFIADLVDDIPSSSGSWLSNPAAEALAAYSWPGNVRQLKNVIAHALIVKQDRCIRPADLNLHGQPRASEPLDPTQGLDDVEAAHIASALKHFDGNVMRTAKSLGIQPNTLRQKLKRYGIERPEARKK